MAKEIFTSIQIEATPEKVWQVLMATELYPEWNPFIKWIKGDLKVGNSIIVQIQDMKFKPKVLKLEPQKEFKWKGKLWINGLFDGTHRFHLIDNGDGTTTLEHSEKFKGILVPLLSKKLDRETQPGFEAMNVALRKKVIETV